MRGKFDHARGWFRKGESDLATVRRMLDGDGPYDTACFHAQQAIEKYLKGVLALGDQPIPRTHNLEDLAQVCSSVLPDSIPSDIDLTEITPYAVNLRYDFEFWPDRDAVERALVVAGRIREFILARVPGRQTKELEKQLDRQDGFVSELRDFHDKLRRAAVLNLDPDLDDGVILNLAPLWEPVPWPEPRKYWGELRAGKYDWSSVAKQLRAHRVAT